MVASVEWTKVRRSLSYAAEGGKYWLVDILEKLGTSSFSVSSLISRLSISPKFADGRRPAVG